MTDQTFKILPLERIRISPHNRKRFNEASLQELGESIKQKGVLQPIVVRPIPPEGIVEFEIVAGERRFRGSKIAEVPSIPAMVRELSDAQAAEIRSIENTQREDVHPLEEALGYEYLIKHHKYTVQQLADKVDKKKPYIAARLKLVELEPEARKAFFDEKLILSTAMLVARIPVKSLQTKAVKEITQPRWANGVAMTAREAADHIQRSYMLQLKDAPFKTTDEDLVPKAGSCTTCPKRTGNQPELFADIESADVCTDPDCFGRKREAWSIVRIAEAEARGKKVIDGKAAAKIFPYQHSSVATGFHDLKDKNYSDPKSRTWKQLAKAAGIEPVLVKNPHNGDIVELVRDEDLKPHLKELGLVSRNGANPGNAAENEKVKKAKAETAFRQRLFSEIRTAAAGKMQREDWIEIAMRMLARVESNDFKRLMGILEWDKDMNAWSDRDGRLRKKVSSLSADALNDLMRDCALIGEVHASMYSTGKPERLLGVAARYGVDVNAIKAKIKAEADAKKKPAAKKAAPAKPAAKKPDAKKTATETAKPKPAAKKPNPPAAALAPASGDTKRVLGAVLNPAAAWPFPTGMKP